MTDEFILEVLYKGEQQDFSAWLVQQGYTHKFRVIVHNTEVFFEPDEEGHYRAISMPDHDEKALARLDRALLAAIQQKIEEVVA